MRPTVGLTGLQGIAMPTYERVSGLGFPVGFDVAIPTLRFKATPLVTYRSQIGAVDPSVEGSVDFPRGITLDYSASRAVFTNDAWIRNDLINGFEFLAFGQDTRNYSRGTRGELRLSHEWNGPGWRVKPELGSKRGSRAVPESTTARMPGSVRLDSATFVARITRRVPAFAAARAAC